MEAIAFSSLKDGDFKLYAIVVHHETGRNVHSYLLSRLF